MKKVYLLGFLLILGASVALAHGKSDTVVKPADLLKLYPQGEKLKPISTPTNKNNPFSHDAGKAKWMKVENASGETIGIIGLEKVTTPHGYLIQAVCFDGKAKNVIKATLLKVTRDEAKELYKLTSEDKWWEKHAPPEKAHDARGVLLRSVARTKAMLKK